MIRQNVQMPVLPPVGEAEIEQPRAAARYIVRLRAALMKILTDISSRITTLEQRGLRDRLFPAGSVYEMMNGQSPADSLGGKWEALEIGERSTKWRRV